ncbi:MAG: type II toxin-antitoxin system VapC family toxin [Alphaproteobacteria bacterium]|nr:type II toxin-antitoxin system VapC family toxin [Alphaproteobacteria bacterium]
MRLLLDTHSLLWWMFDDKTLSRKAEKAIADDQNEVFVSAASAWEITTKFRVGKLPHAAVVANDVAASIDAEGFKALSVSLAHAQLAGALGGDHRDPFDRMLIAQAILENMLFVTNEARFDAYPIKRLW